MRIIILLFLLGFNQLAGAQTSKKPLNKAFIVKSNVFNLVFKKPSICIEKPISLKSSIELSFVQGRVDSFLRTDLYYFNGFLIRYKKYFNELKYNDANPYFGFYAGNLNRVIEKSETYLLGYGLGNSVNFAGRSVRLGGSAGLNFFTKKGINIDLLSSIGFGGYYKQFDKYGFDRKTGGYIDLQLWCSIGYAF